MTIADAWRNVVDEMFAEGSESRTHVALDVPPEGMVLWRRLPSGAHIGVTPQLFGAALLTYTEPGQTMVYLHQWMFDAAHGGVMRAISQALVWDSSKEEEPEGWVRTTYRTGAKRYRRRPDTTPASEYESD